MPRFSFRRKKKASCFFMNSRHGFTFIEIMVTLVVLSAGILAIYQTFFSSLDHMGNLTSRLYANIMLEDRIARMERTLRAYRALPFELDRTEVVNVGVKEIRYTPEMNIGQVKDFIDIFSVDLAYSWEHGGKKIRLSRSAFISDYVTDQNPLP